MEVVLENESKALKPEDFAEHPLVEIAPE